LDFKKDFGTTFSISSSLSSFVIETKKVRVRNHEQEASGEERRAVRREGDRERERAMEG
jgi:hypothetical protein